jgi:DNA repair protein RadA/Sms
MATPKIAFVCRECGGEHSKWNGQCQHCRQWNTLDEFVQERSQHAGRSIGQKKQSPTRLADIKAEDVVRFGSGSQELDRVLGGGFVPGAVVLIGGDPGIGKSTLLLQTLNNVNKQQPVLYITGEESLQQVALHAERLGCRDADMQMLAENNVSEIIQTIKTHKPRIVVVDSIQTLISEDISSAPGSVSQVRESASRLVMLAKQNNCTIILVGHVTKDGALAGPRILEHMVDTVLYFEGDKSSRFRLLRGIKNRFGAVNEIGVFAMTGSGVKDVSNPSGIFLSRDTESSSGSVAFATWEGTRPLLLEVQALVDQSNLGNPRRLALGLDQNRLSMLLAVLHKHAGYSVGDQDVFVNLVGGVRVTEPGVDLAVILAVLSSFTDKPLSRDLLVFGELGLSGEVRPVQGGLERLREAAKLGFTRAIVPRANQTATKGLDIEVVPVARLSDALDVL